MTGPRRREVDGFPETRHPLYQTWYGMMLRCFSEKHVGYPYYGARGITVCEAWQDFAVFVRDIGPRPSPEHTLDRFPNKAGNYEPGNARWASPAQQGANRRVPARPPLGLLRITCEAHAALRRWIEANDCSHAAFARLVTTTRVNAISWLSGNSKPTHHHRLAIERLCGIPATDWLTDDERRIAFGDPSAKEAI